MTFTHFQTPQLSFLFFLNRLLSEQKICTLASNNNNNNMHDCIVIIIIVGNKLNALCLSQIRKEKNKTRQNLHLSPRIPSMLCLARLSFSSISLFSTSSSSSSSSPFPPNLQRSMRLMELTAERHGKLHEMTSHNCTCWMFKPLKMR